MQSGEQSAFQFLTNCGESDWVCGDNCTASPSYILHNLFPGPILQLNITGNSSHPWNTTSPDGSQSTTVTSSAATTSSCHPNSTNDNSLPIGLGVGIPFAVALLLAVVWALWERKRRFKEARKSIGLAGLGAGCHDSQDMAKKQPPPIELGDERPPAPQELQ